MTPTLSVSPRGLLSSLLRHVACGVLGHRYVQQRAELPIFVVPPLICARCGKWQRVVRLQR